MSPIPTYRTERKTLESFSLLDTSCKLAAATAEQVAHFLPHCVCSEKNRKRLEHPV
jgi:hypothetical protein